MKKRKVYLATVEEDDAPETTVAVGTSREQPKPQLSAMRKLKKPRPIDVPECEAACKKFGDFIVEQGLAGLEKQFLEQVTNYTPPKKLYEHKAFDKNKQYARYRDLVCVDHSRVILKNEEPLLSSTDFIHANYVRFENHDRVYISTQAPLPNTVEHFWIMVFQEQCPVIVCIGRKGEFPNFVQYWPLEEGSHENFGKMFVYTRKKEEKAKEFACYTVEVLPDGCSNSHFVKLIHVDTWAEMNKWSTGLAICRLIKQMNSVDALAVMDGPMLIHCSSGVGRTGIVIVVDVCLQMLFKHSKEPDLISICRQLREQRMSSFQRSANFLVVAIAVLAYLERRLPQYKGKYAEMADGFKKYAIPVKK